MPKEISKSDVLRWHRQAQDYCRQWHDEVRTAYQVVERELPSVLDTRFVESIADWQSPDTKKQVNLAIQFLRLNDTLIDAIEGKEGTTGEKEANNMRLWAAREYNRQNFGYWVDDRLGEGLSVAGLSVLRLLSKPWSDAKAKGEDRDEWMKYNLSGIHEFDAVDLLGFSWMPKGNGYEVAFYEAEYPVMTAMDKLGRTGYGDDKKGRYVPMQDMSTQSGVRWVGEGHAVDETDASSGNWDKSVIVTVMEYQDDTKPCPVCPDKHPLWSGVELIRGNGKDFKDAEEVRRYTIGRRHAGTFRLCGQRTSSRPPQYSYKPLQAEVIKIAGWMNWCITMLGSLSNEHSASSRVYLDASKVPDGIQLSGDFWERLYSQPLPAPAENSKQVGVQA